MLIENDNNIGVGWNEKVFINRRLLGIKSRTNRLKDIRIQAEDYLYLSAGTIVVINGDGVREYLSVEDWNSRKDEGLEAIGIVVVPNTHTDDGKGRMMSLRLMSVSDPDNGSLVGKVKQSSDTGDTQFYYPAHGTEFNNNEVGYPCIFSSSSQTKQTFSKFVTKCAFTTTSLEEKNYEYFFVNNKFDKGDWYPCYSYSSGYAPSPYEGERGINPLYRYSGCSTSELNGEINTKKLLEYYGDVQADWRTSETLDNSWRNNCLAVVYATQRYYTVGTKQGDWFLPSIGELGYLAARSKEIQEALDAVSGFTCTYSSWKDCRALSLLTFWSSTDYNHMAPIQHNFLDLYLGLFNRDYCDTNRHIAHSVVAFSNALV